MKKPKSKPAAEVSPELKGSFAFYEKLLGFNAALELLYRREDAAKKLAKLKIKSKTEQQAGSRPDGRLNGPNLALGSLVAQMGGKRKSKKTKRGY
jgi:hypothetical protein